MDSLTPKQRAYLLVGEIATSWSEVEGLWYLIFTVVMKGTERRIIDALFFYFDTSAAQRGLLITAADAAYPRDKNNHFHPTRKQIGKLYDLTNKIAGLRNAAIHARLPDAYTDHTITTLVISVSPGDNKKKPNRLSGSKDVLAELQSIVDQIKALTA